jgi:hypothetical protein
VTPEKFLVRGDGVEDDSDPSQRAIDQIQQTYGEGIVFLPSGQYRISRTIYVWPGVRVIGYGPMRPVLVLGKNRPGFQEGMGYMVLFAGGRPGHDRRRPVAQRVNRPGANRPDPELRDRIRRCRALSRFMNSILARAMNSHSTAWRTKPSVRRISQSPSGIGAA